MSVTKVLFLTSLVVVLVGVGCVSEQSVSTSTSSTVSEPGKVAASVTIGNDLDTATYSLVVDDAYTVTQSKGEARIQNFVGSDDPKAVYADEAFFVEIRDVGASYSMTNLRADYAQVTSATLGGRQVQFATGGVMAGDTWPHEAYFDDQSNTLIILYVNALPGSDFAQALVKGIQWK